jgi:hypothetical protein
MPHPNIDMISARQLKNIAGGIDTYKPSTLFSRFISKTQCRFLQAKHSHHSKWRFCKLKGEEAREHL